jgi:hypothetical protein
MDETLSEGSSVLNGLHDKQLEVAMDTSKRVTNVCGRREGKTTGICRRLLRAAINNPAQGEDESIVPYIGPTKNQAKRLMWGRLQEAARIFRVPMEFLGTDLIARHKNGCQIWIMGADDDRDIARLRGFPFREVEIDEAQAVGADFGDMVDEVLDPALADYNGALRLSGTPNAACVGYFYESSTGQVPGWSNHHGTVLDNPHFPLWRSLGSDWQHYAMDWLTAHREKRGWDEDHPTYQREWMGKWIKDEGGLVYRYRDKNDYIKLPPEFHWEYVFGVDFGFDNAFAIVVWAFCRDLPDVFEVDAFIKSGLTVSQWGAEIKQREDRYEPVAEKADTGALGKAITLEINQRFGTNLTPAEKKDKFGHIELFNSDSAAGLLHLRKDSPLKKYYSILQWDESRKKEDPRFSNDGPDAGLYGFVEAKHWTHEPKEMVPLEGTREHEIWEMEQMEQAEMDAFESERSESCWEH